MNVLDLFSGIGGFSLGLERAGMRTVAFCEIEDYPRRVLARHWPDVPIHHDIRELDGEQYRGTVDLVCGGFPCQPFSVAGQQRGQDDDRHLWPEMLRVIREVQPSWVIGENVAGFIGMELDNCLSDMEAIGYSCQTFVIPACAVDAKHRRDRCWILCHSHSHSHSQSDQSFHDEAPRLSDVFLNSSGTRGGGESRERKLDMECDPLAPRGRDEGANEADRSGPVVSNTSSQRLEGLGLGLGAEKEYSALGDPCRWPAEPRVGRMAHGVPRRVDRLRALGNAVVPQIPEIIGRAILEAETTSPKDD